MMSEVIFVTYDTPVQQLNILCTYQHHVAKVMTSISTQSGQNVDPFPDVVIG
jgi:hypothetical protein